MKISALPLLDPAVMDGTEDLPIVKGLTTYRSTPGNVVDAAFGPLASALAVALGNYRPTYAQAVADLAVGQMFASDASGTMSLYRRISAAPGYQYYDDVVTASLAKARTVSVDLAANIATRRLDASVVAIITGGHTVAGIGAGTYVCDSLATAALALAYPALCKQSGDGRYWRLMPQAGALAIEQGGAIPNDTTKAVGNVTASRAVLAYLSAVCGGGTLSSGAGLFTFDAAALGTTGLVLPSNITVRGAGPASIWAASAMTPGYQLGSSTAPGMLFTAAAGAVNVRIEDMTIAGIATINGVNRGWIRRCVITGCLTSKAQYGETGISFVAAMAAGVRTYRDTSTDTATDIGTTSTAFTDTTITLTGNVLTVTPTMTFQTAYTRYAVSDYVALDPTKIYVARFLNGYYTGDGGISEVFSLYDANKNPIVSNQKVNPTNGYKPNEADQYGTITSIIAGVSYVRLSVGAFKDSQGLSGLTATFDLSKIQILEVVNDYKAWAQHIYNQYTAGGGLGSIDSPANYGQITLYNCVDFHVDQNDFRMVDRACVSMTNCQLSSIDDNVIDYAMHGAVDSKGSQNTISRNHMDGRVLTTSGLASVAAGTNTEDNARIGTRAFRIRGIGGSQTDRLVVADNYIRGFSWGIEILLYTTQRTCTVINNRVDVVFCGMSLCLGTYYVYNPIITVEGDGSHALEVAGSDDGTDPVANGEIAEIYNPHIEFSDFVPIAGPGISHTAGTSVKVQGGRIRAPLGIQNLGSAGASLTVDGTVFEYGWAAIFNRAGAVRVRIPSALPWVKTCNTRGTGAGIGGVINLQPVASTARQDVQVDTIDPGTAQVAVVNGAQNVRLSFPDVVTPRSALPATYITLLAPANGTVCAWELDSIRYRALPSGAFSSAWSGIANAPAINTASRVTQSNCWVNKLPAPCPANTYARSILGGDPWLASFALTNTTIGTVAAGAYVEYTVSVPGAAVAFNRFEVISQVPGGLSGFTVTAWPTADDTVLVHIANNTTAAISRPSAQTLVVVGRIIR